MFQSILSKQGWRCEQVLPRYCVTHEADEEVLESNHKLECIGDIVWQTQVEIQCCPYCGERLNSGLKKMNAVYHHHSYG
jgi:hypothetical protein